MRGKPVAPFCVCLHSWITPADAGKTDAADQFGCAFVDHPRGCGENGTFGQFAPMEEGSPPRMRGKQEDYDGRRRRRRITPADAGKTSSRCLCAFKT